VNNSTRRKICTKLKVQRADLCRSATSESQRMFMVNSERSMFNNDFPHDWYNFIIALLCTNTGTNFSKLSFSHAKILRFSACNLQCCTNSSAHFFRKEEIQTYMHFALTLNNIRTNHKITTNNEQEAQLSPRDRVMRRVSWNLVNCHATVQKLPVWQVLNQVSAVANWPVRQNRAVDSAWRSVR